jgi:hypothetical protein
VDHEVADDLGLIVPGSRANDELVPELLDGHNRRAHLHMDSEAPGGHEKRTHEISVEALERSITAVQDMDLGTAMRRDVRELEGDVSSADEGDPTRQLVQLEEAGTREQVLFSWDAEGGMPRAGGDDHMAAVVDLVTYAEARRTHELCPPVHGQYPGIAKACFGGGGNLVGEGPFEAHHVGPGDRRRRTREPLPLHTPRPVDKLGDADKHLLRIAPALRAGAAEGTGVHDGDAPSRLAAGVGDALGGRSRPHHDEINGHNRHPAREGVERQVLDNLVECGGVASALPGRRSAWSRTS